MNSYKIVVYKVGYGVAAGRENAEQQLVHRVSAENAWDAVVRWTEQVEAARQLAASGKWAAPGEEQPDCADADATAEAWARFKRQTEGRD